MELKTYSIETDLPNGYNAGKLHIEINTAACISEFIGIDVSEGVLIILGSSLDNEAALNNVISSHVPICLVEKKALKIKQIDLKTYQLIGSGFIYDGNSFSLSPNAQLNWLGIKALETLISFPLDITTMSDSSYTLTANNVNTFVGTAVYVVQTALTNGRTLKLAVNAATNQSELDAVVDNR